MLGAIAVGFFGALARNDPVEDFKTGLRENISPTSQGILL
jgi:hypothetical protein